MKRTRFDRSPRAAMWLAAMTLAGAGACAGGADSGPGQALEGQVALDNFQGAVLGVRAIDASGAVTTAPVGTDGRFELDLAPANGYRLEVVTATGAHGFVARGDGQATGLVFDVCAAGDAFDMGHVHGWAEGGEDQPGQPPSCGDPCMADPSQCPVPGCDPGDPNCCVPGPDGSCQPPPPPPCEDPADPNCCVPGPDGSCQPPPPPPCEDPSDPNCCVPGPDGACPPPPPPPPPCEDPSDPNCCVPGPDGSCQVPPCDPTTGTCGGGGSGGGGSSGGGSVPPCDPSTGSGCCSGGYDDPSCWPQPEPPPCATDPGAPVDNTCWDAGAVPQNPVPSFGCDTPASAL